MTQPVAQSEAGPEYGRIVPPYPRETCQADHCGQKLTEETGAYLHNNLANGKLAVLCGDCSRYAELHCRVWLPLMLL